MIVGNVAQVWRYPVMGMQGETLEEARVLLEGITGDHLYVLRSKESNRILGAKSIAYSWGETVASPGMLDLKAELTDEQIGGEQQEQDSAAVTVSTPDGQAYSASDSKFDETISKFLHHNVELIRYPNIVASRVRSGRTVHLLTNLSLINMKQFYATGDFDVRRFRPNIVISMDNDNKSRNGSDSNGFVEETWIGKTIMIGDEAQLRAEKPNVRCKITTMRQSPSISEDYGILQTIENKNGNRLGIMCSVIKEGTIRPGSQVNLS